MSKTTTVTNSYTSNVVANGTTVSGEGVITNGTTVRRVLVNGTDVIHKVTRTVVKANSNLTFTVTFRFNYYTSTLCSFTDYGFSSPIYLDITVTNTSGTSSGFTSITGVDVATRFYCGAGNKHNTVNSEHWYDSALSNQSFTIGQQKTLTFSYYNGKGINYEKSSPTQAESFEVYFSFTDPDGVYKTAPAISKAVSLSVLDDTYRDTLSGTRVVSNFTLTDTTVQEY